MKVLKYRYLLLCVAIFGGVFWLLSWITQLVVLRLIAYIILSFFWLIILYLALSDWKCNRFSRGTKGQNTDYLSSHDQTKTP